MVGVVEIEARPVLGDEMRVAGIVVELIKREEGRIVLRMMPPVPVRPVPLMPVPVVERVVLKMAVKELLDDEDIVRDEEDVRDEESMLEVREVDEEDDPEDEAVLLDPILREEAEEAVDVDVVVNVIVVLPEGTTAVGDENDPLPYEVAIFHQHRPYQNHQRNHSRLGFSIFADFGLNFGG